MSPAPTLPEVDLLEAHRPLRDLFLLREDIVPLNNGSFGACPRPVFEAYQRWQLEFERHPDGYMRRWRDEMDRARAALAEYLGTTSDQLAFVTNATMGVNVVAHSLRAWLREGDQVLTTDHEYAACNNAWTFVCHKVGARYIQRPIPLPLSTAGAWLEAFWAGVTPRTRVIYLSHITSPTALTFPVAAVCQRARQAGILTVVDGAHTPGQRPLSLDALGADFYIGNCHKWMMGPKGSAFLYARREVQHLIEPLIVGHGWQFGALTDQPMREYVERLGTRDLAAFLAVPEAVAFLRAREWDTVRQNCHQVALAVRGYLEAQLGTQPICPPDVEWVSQMVAIRLPDRTDAEALQRLLLQHRIELPVIRWGGHVFARLSVQAYVTPQHLSAFIRTLLEHFS